MSYKLKLDPRIVEAFPSYRAMIIYAQNLNNGDSDERSIELLRVAEQTQRQTFGEEKPVTHPHIAAWREAYKNFGVKPSKYLCSIEALLSRTLKGQDLPTINRIVDSYNAISVRHVLPVGGEDWDCLTSDLTLKFAAGDEPFIVYQNGEELVSYPSPGEVIWADSRGVTCRAWNWRQCYRTLLTTNTKNAYFVLDRLAPYSVETLKLAGDELIELLKSMSPDCKVSYEFLGAQ